MPNAYTTSGGGFGVSPFSTMGIHKTRRSSTKKSRRRKRYKNNSSRKRNRVYKHKKGQRYTPHTAGKRKDTSHRRIRYTSKGQPYVIMGNGKARFIKKKGAKIAHKRKGGRY